MLEALIKHPFKHLHMQVLKQCPSPHLTSPLFTHLPAPSSPSLVCHPHVVLSAAVVTYLTRTRGNASNKKPPTKNPPGGHPRMPITNQDQATALVQIIHTIRATRGHGIADWHPKAIEKTLFSNKNHPAPYPTIVTELTKYAATSDKRTPAFLFDPLRDWKEPGDPRPRNPCESHPTHSAHACPSCRADVLAGIRPKEFIGKAYDVPMTGLD